VPDIRVNLAFDELELIEPPIGTAAKLAARNRNGIGNLPERKVAVLLFVLIIHFHLPVHGRFKTVAGETSALPIDL